MANVITGLRFLFSIAILFVPALSRGFYVLYIAAGMTDMIDGTIARKTHTESEFGSRLDTAADFVFAVVCLIKLLPVLELDSGVIVWIAVIAIIKGINVISGYAMYKRFVAVHSIMNKVVGALLFVMPIAWQWIEFRYSVILVGMAATFAAVQEGHYIRTGNFIYSEL